MNGSRGGTWLVILLIVIVFIAYRAMVWPRAKAEQAARDAATEQSLRLMRSGPKDDEYWKEVDREIDNALREEHERDYARSQAGDPGDRLGQPF
jgi:hypothetical protein